MVSGCALHVAAPRHRAGGDEGERSRATRRSPHRSILLPQYAMRSPHVRSLLLRPTAILQCAGCTRLHLPLHRVVSTCLTALRTPIDLLYVCLAHSHGLLICTFYDLGRTWTRLYPASILSSVVRPHMHAVWDTYTVAASVNASAFARAPEVWPLDLSTLCSVPMSYV